MEYRFSTDLEATIADYAKHATRCVCCVETLDKFQVVDCYRDGVVFVLCSSCFDAAQPDGAALFDAHLEEGEGEALRILRHETPATFVIVVARGESRKFAVAMGPRARSDAFQADLHRAWTKQRANG